MTAVNEEIKSDRERVGQALHALEANVERVIRGKSNEVRLSIACLTAGGHLLIEDRPGTGKTSLAKAIAASIGGIARRVQFTPDLLPSDITGVSVFNPVLGEFTFREGPTFTNILIADEINRASPKTQAALLEVMEERQVTSDGVSRPVPSPFMVVATQNPMDFQGTYPLPEVQLDRFAMKITLGYANREAELEVMSNGYLGSSTDDLQAVLTLERFAWLMAATRSVRIGDALRGYVADIVGETRTHPDLRLGVSTRGTLTLLAVAKSYALANDRWFVSPDDIKLLCAPVLTHRMAVTADAEIDGVTETDVIVQILERVPVPRSRR